MGHNALRKDRRLLRAEYSGVFSFLHMNEYGQLKIKISLRAGSVKFKLSLRAGSVSDGQIGHRRAPGVITLN